MAPEHLLCAEHFHVSAPTVVGDATVVPVLEMKKLRLREHSCLPKDTWLCGVKRRLWSQVCRSPQSCFPPRAGQGRPRGVL